MMSKDSQASRMGRGAMDNVYIVSVLEGITRLGAMHTPPLDWTPVPDPLAPEIVLSPNHDGEHGVWLSRRTVYCVPPQYSTEARCSYLLR